MPLANNININESYLFFEDKKLLGFSQEAIKYIQEQAQKILELENENYKLKNEKRELGEKAYYDHLTGLLNRHGLEEKIKKYFKNGENISLISIDIEKLKVINDYYGSNSGDDAIKNTANIIKKYFRQIERNGKKDLICRWGGDEFIIITARINLDILKERIKIILKEVEEINKNNLENKKYPYSLHIGIINEYIIDNFQIATAEGFKQAKAKLKEVS